MEYYSVVKKKKNEILYSNMDELAGYYVKWNGDQMEKQTLYDFTYMWNLKKYKKLVNITKNKQTQRYKLVVTSDKGQYKGCSGRCKLLGAR